MADNLYAWPNWAARLAAVDFLQRALRYVALQFHAEMSSADAKANFEARGILIALQTQIIDEAERDMRRQ